MHRAALLAIVAFGCGGSASGGAATAEHEGPGPWAEQADVLRLPVPIDGAPGRGAEHPLVTVIVFSDFQCPFCREAAPLLDALERARPNEIRTYFRHLPLPFHEHAQLAAEASEEARAQGGDAAFWRYHDRLFASEGALAVDDLVRYAGELRLDTERFRVALRGRVHRDRVERDMELADMIGLEGTPVFFVNGRPILGVPERGDLDAMIEEEIALANQAMERGIARERLYDRLLADATAILRERMRRRREQEAEADRELDLNQIYAVPVDGAASIGPADAPVTIVVFSDFQCPFCSQAVPTLAALFERYPNELRVVFRHNPLSFHRYAADAARAAEEARAQQGDRAFWAMHDRLFANQDALRRDDLERYAAEIGLDAARFAAALDEGTHGEVIERDQAIAARFGALSTPMFFVNGRLVQGAQPLEVFAAVFEEARDRAQAALDRGASRDAVYEAVIEGGAQEAVWIQRSDRR